MVASSYGAMRRTVVLLAVFTALGVAAVLASCGPSSNSTPPQCVAPAGVEVQMVYPVPGATGVPDAFTQVVLATQGTLPSTFSVTLVGSTFSGIAYFGAVLPAPTPLPSPAATPAFANPTYLTSTNGGYTFPAGTTLTAQLNDLNSNCVPGTVLGTFTVQ